MKKLQFISPYLLVIGKGNFLKKNIKTSKRRKRISKKVWVLISIISMLILFSKIMKDKIRVITCNVLHFLNYL